eukprot:TRINITY_DN54105_c0_g2_i1.p1 TRINITY_DN54105_c0_g2~~TRINITY_DN54105_c0_g2_i1.p1  ORF type:complete len:368 (-),score=44.18 TRINITY_DN54105_c0_g2_i1:40-1143(-)
MATKTTEQHIQGALDAVLVESTEMPEGTPIVQGYDFNSGIDVDALLDTYSVCGFQATNFGNAVSEINAMLNWRMDPAEKDEWTTDDEIKAARTRIFLGYTSNLVNSGLRDVFKFLAQHSLVQVIVTSGGGIEDDFVKCFEGSQVGGCTSTENKAEVRFGNVRVSRDAQQRFEQWLLPLIDKAVERQVLVGENRFVWTPSKFISFMGQNLNLENKTDSIYYWTATNNIPVYCPAITDGLIGRIIMKHSRSQPKEKRLVLDLTADIKGMNQQATKAKHTGMIILGGGLVKHHICNANLMRNGANHSIFLNTGQEFDGSDAGARPDEAKSWGKIRMDAKPVKIYSDATLVFPFLVQKTFYQHVLAAQKGR